MGAMSLIWACDSKSSSGGGGGSSSIGQFSKLSAPMSLEQLKDLTKKDSFTLLSGSGSDISFDNPTGAQLEKIQKLAEILTEANEDFLNDESEDCYVELFPAEKKFVVDDQTFSLDLSAGDNISMNIPNCISGNFEIRRNSNSEFWVIGFFESKEIDLLAMTGGKPVKIAIEAYAKNASSADETYWYERTAFDNFKFSPPSADKHKFEFNGLSTLNVSSTDPYFETDEYESVSEWMKGNIRVNGTNYSVVEYFMAIFVALISSFEMFEED